MLLNALGDFFTFQTFGDREKSNKLVKVLHGTLEECRSQLEQLNQVGAGVFFTVNQTDGRGRQESNITRVRALFADFDTVDHNRQFDYFLPPSYVVESSPGKHHAYWILSDELPLHLFKQYQSALSLSLESDPKICDLPRVMRVPGFIHSKRDSFTVREIISSDRTYTVAELKHWLWIDDDITGAPIGPSTNKYGGITTTPPGIPINSTTEEKLVYVKDCPDAASRFEELILDLSLAEEGARNNTLNRVAFEAYGYVRAGRLYKEDVYNALIECSVDLGLTEDEADTTINSAIKKSKPIFSALQLLPDLPDTPETDQDASELNKIGTPIVWMSELENAKPDWLWKGYLCRDALHMLAGQGGIGKTTICVNLAAIVSRGGVFPDGQRLEKAKDVLYFTTEDDIEMTVRPRLQAAGADMDKVGIIRAIEIDGKKVHFNPAKHMPYVAKAALESKRDIGLVIIDPIVSAISGDHNKNEEVRRGLEPVLQMAKKLRCAVLGITHVGKGKQGASASERMLGSTAFTNVARITMFAVKVEHGDGTETRHFAKEKANITSANGGFVYSLEQKDVDDIEDVNYIKWGAYDDRSATDILIEGDQPVEEKSAFDEACEFLKEILKDGPVDVKDIESAARREGISMSTVRRVRKKYNVKSEIHSSRAGGRSSVWQWPDDGLSAL